jgi:excisionase family DNA binding protein
MIGEVFAFPPALMTKEQAAFYLSTSPTGIRDLIRLGMLTAVDDGGKRTKIRRDDLDAYVRSLPEKDPERHSSTGAAGRATILDMARERGR